MRRLSKFLISVLFFGQLLSCSNDKGTRFTGDLYFKLISAGSFYKADSIAFQRLNNYLDSLKSINKDSLTDNDKEVISFYDGLKVNGLITKPYFHLRVDSVTFYIVYTDATEYKKIEEFNHHELNSENKKVIIELTGDLLNLGTSRVIDCKTIDKVEVVDGKTYWSK